MSFKKTKKAAKKKIANIKRIKKKKKSVKQKTDEKNTNFSEERVVKDPPTKAVARPTRQADSPVYKTWPDWGDRYLKYYKKHYVKSLACDATDIHFITLRRYMRGCKEFRDSCEAVRDSITDLLEESALHRAIHGTDDIYLFEGEPVYLADPLTGVKSTLPLVKRKWETSLTTFMLKGRRREEYYPENSGIAGSADDKAASVREAIAEITRVMAPPPNWEEQQEDD